MLHVPNFIDYLQSGLQINLVTAIDFTGNSILILSFQWNSNQCRFSTLPRKPTNTVSTSTEINMECDREL